MLMEPFKAELRKIRDHYQLSDSEAFDLYYLAQKIK